LLVRGDHSVGDWSKKRVKLKKIDVSYSENIIVNISNEVLLIKQK